MQGEKGRQRDREKDREKERKRSVNDKKKSGALWRKNRFGVGVHWRWYRRPLAASIAAPPISGSPSGALLVPEVDFLKDSLRMDVICANNFAAGVSDGSQRFSCHPFLDFGNRIPVLVSSHLYRFSLFVRFG